MLRVKVKACVSPLALGNIRVDCRNKVGPAGIVEVWASRSVLRYARLPAAEIVQISLRIYACISIPC